MNCKNITLFITTKNRNTLLYELLQYYDNSGFNGTILVVDSSDIHHHRLITGHKFKFHFNLIHDADDLKVQEIFDKYSKLIETEYCMWSGDDDYYILSSICELRDFLDKNNDYDIGGGQCLALYRESKHGLISNSYTYIVPDIEDETLRERFVNLTNSFSPGLFYLCRASIWKEMVDGISLVKEKVFSTEYIPTVVGILRSRVKFLDKLVLIRMIHPNRGVLTLPHQFTIDELKDFSESKLQLVERILKADVGGELVY